MPRLAQRCGTDSPQRTWLRSEDRQARGTRRSGFCLLCMIKAFSLARSLSLAQAREERQEMPSILESVAFLCFLCALCVRKGLFLSPAHYHSLKHAKIAKKCSYSRICCLPLRPLRSLRDKKAFPLARSLSLAQARQDREVSILSF